MTWLVIQLWLEILVAFILGAVLAWVIVQSLYKPVDEVAAEVGDLPKGSAR